MWRPKDDSMLSLLYFMNSSVAGWTWSFQPVVLAAYFSPSCLPRLIESFVQHAHSHDPISRTPNHDRFKLTRFNHSLYQRSSASLYTMLCLKLL